MPVAHTPELQQRGLTPGGFTVVGRLRDGVSLQEARAELETINRRLEAAYPATNRGLVPTVATHSRDRSAAADAPLIWGSLWAAAWFVLLIACANVANLTLVRTIGRWREFSTRIGARRRPGAADAPDARGEPDAGGRRGGRSAGGSPTGVCARGRRSPRPATRSSTTRWMPARSPIWWRSPSPRRSLCSLAPIGRVVQLGVSGALKGDARGVTQGLRGKHLAAGLVAGQMALAIVLLSGAGVLVRSFVNIVGAETGVRDPERILVGSMRLPSDKYPSPETRLAYFDRLEARLKTIPGIEEESVSSTIPVKFAGLRTFEIEGRPSPPDGEESVAVLERRIGLLPTWWEPPRYPAATSTTAIVPSALPVAIVNQSFAARFWPGEQPLGKRLRAMNRNTPGEWRTVVGVVPNIMQGDPLRQTVQTAGLRARSSRNRRRACVLSRANERASGPGGTSRSSRGAEIRSRCDPGRLRHLEGQLRIRSRLHGCRAQRVGEAREGGAGLRR